MTDGLLRQRRNLMVTSLIIILLSFGGVKIEEVGALGTKLVFQRKDALYLGIWVIYAYFFFRYYQYVREEPDLGISKAFWAKVNALTFASLRKAAVKQLSLDETQLAGEFHFSGLKRKSRVIRTGKVVSGRDSYGEPVYSHYEVNVLRFGPAFVWASAHVILNRAAITDYVLPFVVGIAAAVAGAPSSWEGSLCKLVFQHTALGICG
jgi:hypothetical protein